jgi:membrane-associated phospholipid phosphatase
MQKTNTDPLKTILIIVLGLIILYFKFQYNWILFIALIITILGLISKKASEIIDYLWMRLAWLLSLIVPKIILSAFYYLLLFPMALISKVFGNKNGIVLKNNRNSFFLDVNKEFNKSSFEKPW